MRDIPAALRPTFCELVAGDVHWFYEVLPFAPSARLLLAAGGMIRPAPGDWLNIGSYLEEQAALNGAQIEFVAGRNRLIASGGCVSLPLHSFGSGPAAQDRFKLVEDVFTAREQLLSLLR